MMAFIARWLSFLLLNVLVAAIALVWTLRMSRKNDGLWDHAVTWTTLSFSIVIGLQIYLGTLGRLRPESEMVVLSTILAVSLLMHGRRLRSKLQRELTRLLLWGREEHTRFASQRPSAMQVAVACLVLALIIGALAEPSTMFDTLAYHMPMVVEWMQSEQLTPFYLPSADYSNSYFPGNGQLLYLWSLAPLRSDLLVNCTNLALWALFALALMDALKLVGVTDTTATTIAVTSVLTPVALSQAIDQSLDVAMAAFFALSLGHLMRLRRSMRVRDAALSGLSMGCVLGVKYSGPAYVLILLTLLLAIVVERRRTLQHDNRRAAAILVAGAGMLALGGFWYVRNYVLTGNPVYPMRVSIASWVVFPGPGNDHWEYLRLWNYVRDLQVVWLATAAFVRSYGIALSALLFLAGPALARGMRDGSLLTQSASERRRLLLVFGVCGIVTTTLYLRTPYSIMRFSSEVEIDTTLLAAGMRFALSSVVLWLVAAGLAISDPGSDGVSRSGLEVILAPAVLQALLVSYDRNAAGFMARRLFSYHQLLTAMALVMTGLVAWRTVLWRSLCQRARCETRPRVTLVVVLLIVLGLLTGALGYGVDQYRDFHRSAIYRREYGHLADGWAWVSGHIAGARIAYTGLPLTYPMYDREFTSEIRYVNVSGGLDWRYHDFTLRGRYYRDSESDYGDWIRNLGAWDTDYLVLSGNGRLVEADWASQHPDVFVLAYSSEGLSVYEVRLP
jgi:hypothetical protein